MSNWFDLNSKAESEENPVVSGAHVSSDTERFVIDRFDGKEMKIEVKEGAAPENGGSPETENGGSPETEGAADAGKSAEEPPVPPPTDDALREFIAEELKTLRGDLCAAIERTVKENALKPEEDKDAEDSKEPLLNKMHDELQRWRSNFYQKDLLNPIHLGLLEAYDLVVNAGRGGDPAEQLRELPDHLEGIFQNLGFDIIKPEIGFVVKPGERSLKIVKTEPAPSPEQDRTVAAVHKTGFFRIVEREGREQYQLLRPAWVTMYLYDENKQ